jgi:NTE family protein
MESTPVESKPARPKKTALILSGGGAKGAFQCGAEKYAREVKGYQWDIIAGVSVGALNASMLSMEKYARLFEVWNTISNDQVYTGGFNLWSLIRILFGAKSFYGNQPLRELLDREFDPTQVCKELLVGVVSLVSGEYIQFRGDHPNIKDAVLASTVMPIIWEPLDISPDLPGMVDGGVRNISPIGDVLEYEPDEVVIINCSARASHPIPAPPPNLLKIGMRSLDIVLNELFVGDIHEFMRINELVKQAQAQGFVLYNPDNGKPYKWYDCKVIEPDEPLGDTLDFSQATIQRSIEAGVRKARQVLGR